MAKAVRMALVFAFVVLAISLSGVGAFAEQSGPGVSAATNGPIPDGG